MRIINKSIREMGLRSVLLSVDGSPYPRYGLKVSFGGYRLSRAWWRPRLIRYRLVATHLSLGGLTLSVIHARHR